MPVTIRPVKREEIADFRRTILRVFGMEWPESEEEDERYVSLLPPERTLAVFDGPHIVGTSGTFELEMSIPGGSTPIAALTMVTVAQTHRRRGLLRRMMDAHIGGAEARGDALSVLWASEAPIYGRYGYGVAAEHDLAELDTRGLTIPLERGQDSITLVEREHLEVLRPLYDACREDRAGLISRSDTWWRERHLRDPAFRRRGASARRYVVSERDGTPTGFLVYRQRPKMDAGIADGEVLVTELLAQDARAEASLWRYAIEIDLCPRLSAWNLPVDSPLPWLVDDRRRVRRRRTDSLWVRICDVPAALEKRRYETDGDVCFAIVDPLDRVGGSYSLSVRAGRATCEPTDQKPMITLSLDTLGTLYLGGFRACRLARAGALVGAQEVVARIDRLFATDSAPWCAEVF